MLLLPVVRSLGLLIKFELRCNGGDFSPIHYSSQYNQRLKSTNVFFFKAVL